MSPVYIFDENPTAAQIAGKWIVRVLWYVVGIAVPAAISLFGALLLLTPPPPTSKGFPPIAILAFRFPEVFAAHAILLIPWSILLVLAIKTLMKWETLAIPVLGFALGIGGYYLNVDYVGAPLFWLLNWLIR